MDLRRTHSFNNREGSIEREDEVTTVLKFVAALVP